MAKQVQLKVQPRQQTGRGEMKKLRAGGVIPAVIYGGDKPPVSLAITEQELEKALQHGGKENVLVDLLVDDQGQTSNRLALIQEVQHHPVSDAVLHVDFHEVSVTEKLRTSVPVRAVGEPSGVKNAGGILECVLRNLDVECLPQDLPDLIEVNVEALEIGQSIKVGDIKPPPGVTFLEGADLAVFIVDAPITEEEEAALGAEAAVGEPEVIGEEKAEGEEGEGEAEAEGAEAKKGEKGEKGEAKGKAEAGKADAKPAAGAAAAGKPAAGAKPAGGKAEGKK